jgi:hypothetical protein
MQIESGKHYVRRDGVEVGPAQAAGCDDYPWVVGDETYTDGGLYFRFTTTESDLVAEVTRDQPFTLEAEKSYQTRDGIEIGPMARYDRECWHSPFSEHPFSGGLWNDDGSPQFPGNRDSPALVAAVKSADSAADAVTVPTLPAFDYEPGDRVIVISGAVPFAGKTGTVLNMPVGGFTGIAVNLDNGDQRFFQPDELDPLVSFEVGDWVTDPDGDICIVFHDDDSGYRQFTVGSTITGESYNYGPADLKHYCPVCTCGNDNDDLEEAIEDATSAFAYVAYRARAA